jgi:hypothetical protein
MNPYNKPLNSIIKAENVLWEQQRIQWDKNYAKNERCEINARVIFVFDKNLVVLQRKSYAYLIPAGTIGRLIIGKNSLLVRLESTDAAFQNGGLFCYFLTGYNLGDVLPGFLRLVLADDVRCMECSAPE